MPFLISTVSQGLAQLQDGSATQQTSLVLQAALQALGVYCSSAPLTTLFAGDVDLLAPLAMLLHSPDHRMASVDALIQLAERKGPKVRKRVCLRTDEWEAGLVVQLSLKQVPLKSMLATDLFDRSSLLLNALCHIFFFSG